MPFYRPVSGRTNRPRGPQQILLVVEHMQIVRSLLEASDHALTTRIGDHAHQLLRENTDRNQRSRYTVDHTAVMHGGRAWHGLSIAGAGYHEVISHHARALQVEFDGTCCGG